MHTNKIEDIKTYILNILVISIIINFVWEMAQMPFYHNMPWNLKTAVFCFAASLGDSVMILIIFFTGVIFLKDNYWINDLNLKKILFTLTLGLILAVFVELSALRLGLWSYSDLMPNIMFLSIGFFPTLQMLILPLGVFQLTKLKKI